MQLNLIIFPFLLRNFLIPPATGIPCKYGILFPIKFKPLFAELLFWIDGLIFTVYSFFCNSRIGLYLCVCKWKTLNPGLFIINYYYFYLLCVLVFFPFFTSFLSPTSFDACYVKLAILCTFLRRYSNYLLKFCNTL